MARLNSGAVDLKFLLKFASEGAAAFSNFRSRALDMTDIAASDFRHPRQYVRLDTILRLRWLAVLGQLAAIFIVAQGLEFDLPVAPCVIIVELAGLLFFTGGLENPFSFLFLAPVLISATALPIRLTISLGMLAVACA